MKSKIILLQRFAQYYTSSLASGLTYYIMLSRPGKRTGRDSDKRLTNFGGSL
jgi:hypothetical protein